MRFSFFLRVLCLVVCLGGEVRGDCGEEDLNKKQDSESGYFLEVMGSLVFWAGVMIGGEFILDELRAGEDVFEELWGERDEVVALWEGFDDR